MSVNIRFSLTFSLVGQTFLTFLQYILQNHDTYFLVKALTVATLYMYGLDKLSQELSNNANWVLYLNMLWFLPSRENSYKGTKFHFWRKEEHFWVFWSHMLEYNFYLLCYKICSSQAKKS